ncbi:hypothetical protein [Frankia sp. R82]|uniref:hypothetical protein n=1 Tax=Frankia sp. R82 TaxID=2950553 RepID=UPI002044B50A|nr:hypothetical protein [Frankia sp. R82]MCM3882142.1 hypothetical protein [Frankia sp. R82]
MPSIPPHNDRWHNPFDGRPFVSLTHPEPEIHALTLETGASLHDMIDVVAALPRLIYVDNRRRTPWDSAVTLYLRALPDLGTPRFGGP